MGNLVLLIERKLGDRLSELGEEDERIVAETAVPERFPGKDSRTGFLDRDEAIAAVDKDETAVKGASPVGDAFHLGEEEGVALACRQLGSPVGSPVSGRVDTGSSAQGGDRQARIVGQSGHRGERIQSLGLDEGVPEIIAAVLFDLDFSKAQISGGKEPVAGKERGQLPDLVQVEARNQDIHAGRIPCPHNPLQASRAGRP